VDFLFVIATKAYAPALIILASRLSRMELALETAASSTNLTGSSHRRAGLDHNRE
jgi:hypothetical protein